MPTVAERFWDKVVPEPMSGCWLWIGARDANGYGQFYLNGRVIGAHRAVWFFHAGALPNSPAMDHKCRNHSCVNPGHLEPVTHRVNTVERGSQENPRSSARYAARTHCDHGHPFDEHNTIWLIRASNSRFRLCRACRDSYNKIYMPTYYATHKEKWRK